MRTALKSAKECKRVGYFFKKVIPIDLTVENYFDNAVPFKFEFVKGDQKNKFLVPSIRTRNYTHYIYTFRDLDYEVGDKIVFDRLIWTIEDVNIAYYESTQFKAIKRYFLTLR